MSSLDSCRRTQVAVVGAGPVGLVVALRLVQQGVGVRVLEQQRDGGTVRANRDRERADGLDAQAIQRL